MYRSSLLIFSEETLKLGNCDFHAEVIVGTESEKINL